MSRGGRDARHRGALDRKPSALSGGQRQRVALGRALVRDPVAFLLDEPLSNLDAKLSAGMRRELVKLHRTLGRTIVHVTHDQVEAMTMGERICIMNEGRIVQVGQPARGLSQSRRPVCCGIPRKPADEPPEGTNRHEWFASDASVRPAIAAYTQRLCERLRSPARMRRSCSAFGRRTSTTMRSPVGSPSMRKLSQSKHWGRRRSWWATFLKSPKSRRGSAVRFPCQSDRFSALLSTRASSIFSMLKRLWPFVGDNPFQ